MKRLTNHTLLALNPKTHPFLIRVRPDGKIPYIFFRPAAGRIATAYLRNTRSVTNGSVPIR